MLLAVFVHKFERTGRLLRSSRIITWPSEERIHAVLGEEMGLGHGAAG